MFLNDLSQAEHPIIDLGEVLVGSCKSFDVPLLNNSSCAFSYSLSTQQSITVTDLPEDMTQDPLGRRLYSLY